MSKYEKLWEYVAARGEQSFSLTFGEVERIAGVPMDHSFLKYKKELADFRYKAGKISMKNETVEFHKLD